MYILFLIFLYIPIYSRIYKSIITNSKIFIKCGKFIQCIFYFLGFQTLYLRTLKEDNKTPGYFDDGTLKPILSIIIVITIFIFMSISHFKLIPILNFNNGIMELVIGIFNGIAMLLLFSRFISMEYFFKNSKISFQREYYFYTVVFILPIYVVAQPLYGVFELIDESILEEFKTFVFYACF